VVLQARAKYVCLPAEDGEAGILNGHAPLLAALKAGKVKYDDEADGVRKTVDIPGGIAEVINNEVTVII
jgi:F-type H+-transporting ATPase subunit epsilon